MLYVESCSEQWSVFEGQINESDGILAKCQGSVGSVLVGGKRPQLWLRIRYFML